MKTWNVILGVDVSKLSLDICCAARKLHIKIDNCSKGFAELKKWCRLNRIQWKEVLVVLEFTGGYEYRFLQFCQSIDIAYCRVPGLEIKQSMGMIRGKNDQVDAYRIGRYGEEKSQRLIPSRPLDSNILDLRQLLSYRKRVVRDKAGQQSTLKERIHMYGQRKADPITKLLKIQIKHNQAVLAILERQIRELVSNDEVILRNYRILTSIKGVGDINAWMTIAYTENFNSFQDGRKYAVYVGVIPFEHTSGTSIRGRRRVSHLANKELKQELNQAAKSAIQHDPEIREYAERKLKTKPYGLVLNNVKFKLILRMFSLVRRNQMYVENYKMTA
ncbi:IS110 family transposase ISCaa7 [compost metagenome]